MSRRCVIVACVFFAGAMPVNSFAAPGDFIDVFVSSPPAELDWASAVTFGPDGNLYVTNKNSSGRVSRYDGQTGEFIDHFTSEGPPVPHGLTFGPDGDLYVSCPTCIVRVNGKTGAFVSYFVIDNDNLDGARHLTFGPDGHIYIVSLWTQLVACYDGTTGALIDTLLPGGYPLGLAFGPDGLLYVSVVPEQGGNAFITRFDIDTRKNLGLFATEPGWEMTGLRFGPCNDLYAAEFSRNTVVRFDATTGEYLGDFTAGHLRFPEDLTFGPDGNLYVAATYIDHDEVVRFRGWDALCLGIPAIGAWGTVAMALGLAAVGTIRLRRDGRVRLGARVVKGRTSCHEDA